MNESEEKRSAREAIELKTKESERSSDTVLVLDVQIKNNSDYSVKDFVVECVIYGASKTEIHRVKKTVFQVVKPKETKTAADINFGFINSQTASFGCGLVDFFIIQ